MTPQIAEPLAAEEVRATVQAVLSRPEFRREPSLLWKIVRWILERLDFDADAATALEVTRWLLVVFGTTLALVVILLAVRLYLARSSGGDEGAADDPRNLVATRVALLRRRARRAREAGDLGLALRYLFFALVVGLGQRGNLHYRDSWTNRELLERGRPTAGIRSMLEPLLDAFEAKEFGREPATGADVRRLEELCDRWLGRLEGGAA